MNSRSDSRRKRPSRCWQTTSLKRQAYPCTDFWGPSSRALLGPGPSPLPASKQACEIDCHQTPETLITLPPTCMCTAAPTNPRSPAPQNGRHDECCAVSLEDRREGHAFFPLSLGFASFSFWRGSCRWFFVLPLLCSVLLWSASARLCSASARLCSASVLLCNVNDVV